MTPNDIETEAAQWLARIDRGDLSAEESREFARWKAADARRMAAYVRLSATWQALDRIQVLRNPLDEPCSSDLSPRWHAGRFARRTVRTFSAVAGIVVLLFGAWFCIDLQRRAVYRTGKGGFQSIVLADQSTIKLNTDTELRVRLTREMRVVELVRGEASFEVAHDPGRPFIVAMGGTAVRAVGTKFNVLRLDSSIEVIVDEGKVAVGTPELLEQPQLTASTNLRQIAAGQSAVATDSGIRLEALPKGGVARRLAWQNQMLVFDGDTLSAVVHQFNRYNERQLLIADPALGNIKIGGYFRPTNLDAFVSTLQSNFGVHVSTKGKRIVLT